MKHAIVLYLLSAGAALAHGGHEAAATQGPAHWLTLPDHAVVLVLAGFALGVAVQPLLRRIKARLAKA